MLVSLHITQVVAVYSVYTELPLPYLTIDAQRLLRHDIHSQVVVKSGKIKTVH